jgi:hypothetical protein
MTVFVCLLRTGSKCLVGLICNHRILRRKLLPSQSVAQNETSTDPRASFAGNASYNDAIRVQVITHERQLSGVVEVDFVGF